MGRGMATFNPLSEIRGMNPDLLVDSVLLSLHIRQLESSGQAANSLRARRGAVERLSKYLDPNRMNPRCVTEADPTQLIRWQADISHLALWTRSKYVMHVRQFYAWLVRPMRVIEESPADDLMRVTPKRLTPRPISEEALSFALDSCTDSRMFAWLLLAAYAGLRAFDIAALRCDDLITTGTVPYLRVRGKGGHESLVAVGAQIVNVLTPYAFGQGPMFPDEETRQRMDSRLIYGAINEYLKSLGLPYTLHQLRHRYGTKLYEMTNDLIYVQKQMRHSSITSTQVYTAVDQAKHPHALKAFDEQIAGHTDHRKGGRR